MFGYSSLSAVVVVTALFCSQAIEDQPTFSKFKYDKQMLETMVRMEAKIDQWDKERKTFEENVLAILEHRREEMQEKFLKQDEKLENMSKDYRDIRADLKNRTLQLENIPGSSMNTTNIAFHAYTTSGGNYVKNQLLIFPYVLINLGEGYDKATGCFTAPVTGLYLFSAHICNKSSQYMIISIIHKEVVIAKTDAFESDRITCSSVSAPVMVKMGEKVSIMSSYGSCKLYADYDYRWPSFAGVLLHV